MSATPGPWTAHIVDQLWIEPPVKSDPVICDLLPREADVFTVEDVANAYLIAAAPDLYAALLAIVEQYGPWHDDDCPADDTCACSAKPFHDAINAAVSKAEGR